MVFRISSLQKIIHRTSFLNRPAIHSLEVKGRASLQNPSVLFAEHSWPLKGLHFHIDQLALAETDLTWRKHQPQGNGNPHTRRRPQSHRMEIQIDVWQGAEQEAPLLDFLCSPTKAGILSISDFFFKLSQGKGGRNTQVF